MVSVASLDQDQPECNGQHGGDPHDEMGLGPWMLGERLGHNDEQIEQENEA